MQDYSYGMRKHIYSCLCDMQDYLHDHGITSQSFVISHRNLIHHMQRQSQASQNTEP